MHTAVLHISDLQSQVVKGRQVFRHSINAHFKYRVGRKRMASLHSRGHISYQKVNSRRTEF